ncbi:phosphodiester glycosidase family protein [Lysobacter sp. K5869]|uniref:phosphodiester glycosidase family protein n=1 Tax=Lysobacter sp. K5869 TaxID=2820808 RepID=UPI001C0632CF|nr:phosphodiester glycosidase family protein [Lysobacter sp. K5869]QWP76288.1 phosphodiester glycosidase family protein [Lysobacter sp. K5869]
MRRAAAWICLALASLLGLPAAAREPRYTVLRVDTRTQQLALFLGDERGRAFHRFKTLDAWLQARGRRLRLAMNAGMFEPDYSPVGLFVADGRERAPLNLRDGAGNFYLKPNGVFLLDRDGKPRVIEAARYPEFAGGARLATQSGPLLLEGGRVHPALDPDSRSRHLRNGIGVKGDEVIWAISDDKVSLYEFARYFRDELGCRDALYLDGTLSSLYAPELKRADRRGKLGPILAVTEPSK